VRLYYGSGGANWSLQWTMEYAYDAFDQLVRRSIDTDGPGGYAPIDGFYSHENGQIVLEFGQYSYGSLTNRYVWGPQTDLLLVNEFNSALYGSGNILYGLGDLVNTVHDSAKYNSSTGTSAVVTHRYIDAFGAAGSYINFDGQSYSGGPFIYTGRFRDDMTGLQWNLHRWYDSSTGRWMSEDPIGFEGGDYNLYRYVGNSPLASVDPAGLAGDSVSVAIKRCLELPFPENVRCLNDLLGSGYKDKQIRILQCELVYGAYKAAGASCRKCDPTMTKIQLLEHGACFSAEVSIRARYLSMDCDCILPASIARGSAKAKAGHVQELAEKAAAASNCYALAAIAKK
jgi:RHS repeat-associated protein